MIETRKTGKTRVFAAFIAATPILFAAGAIAQDGGPQGDPPSMVARIGYTQGDVSYMAAGSSQWNAGLPNYPMQSGDRLYCDQASRAEIGAGSTDVRMWADTDVTLTNLTEQYEQIGLAQGSIRVRVYSINPGGTVEVDTPNGSAIITQPGDYRFDAFGGDGGSDAVINSGALQVTGPNGLNQELTAGQAVQMTGTDQVQLTPLNLPAFDQLDSWSIERDHQMLNSQSAQYVSRETPGYSDLDANGSWSPSPDYGPVWYPSSVPGGWRPYSAGHWAYVAPWGYTWIDDAPWGYAPFHYGRWANIQGRWGWCPGPPAVAPVYSPALVAFVGGGGISIGIGIGGGGVAAWFPLGVGEPFVPWYHASPAYARQVNVTNVNITNIHNTTIINNYNTYITNTRTVNNVNQINTSRVQYANRAQVTAVPTTAMSGGRSVTQSAVKLTPAMQQQLVAAPVHAAPSAPAPTRSLLVARTNVKAPVAAPMLVTPRGIAKAVPATNAAQLRPVALPKPQPATALAKPVAGAVAGRPATAQPPTAKAVMKAVPPTTRPVAPVATTPASLARPAVPQPRTTVTTPAVKLNPPAVASPTKPVTPTPMEKSKEILAQPIEKQPAAKVAQPMATPAATAPDRTAPAETARPATPRPAPSAHTNVERGNPEARPAKPAPKPAAHKPPQPEKKDGPK